MTLSAFYHPDSPGGNSLSPTSDGISPVSPLDPAGFQLAEPSLAQFTEPGLFDDLPVGSLTGAHRALSDCPAADRMLIAGVLPVPATSKVVASVLLRHGWRCGLSRESICALAGLEHVAQVTRAINALASEGLVRRRKLTSSGLGFQGYEYVFDGLTVCRVLVTSGVGPLVSVAASVLLSHGFVAGNAGRGDDLSPRPETPGAKDVEPLRSRGNDLLPRPETPGAMDIELLRSRGDDLSPRRETPGRKDIEPPRSRGDDLSPRPETPEAKDIEPLRSRGDDLSPRPETPEAKDIEPLRSRGDDLSPRPETPEAKDIEPLRSRGDDLSPRPDHDDDLIDEYNLINKSVNHINQSGESRGDKSSPRPVLREPEWFIAFAARMGAQRAPSWAEVCRLREEGGLSTATLRRAAERYESVYGGQVVRAPLPLFSKIALSLAPAGGGKGAAEPGVGASPAPVARWVEPEPAAVGLWERVLALLEERLPRATVESYLEGSVGLGIEGNVLLVGLASESAVIWAEQRIYQTVLRVVGEVVGPGWDVVFEVKAIQGPS